MDITRLRNLVFSAAMLGLLAAPLSACGGGGGAASRPSMAAEKTRLRRRVMSKLTSPVSGTI